MRLLTIAILTLSLAGCLQRPGEEAEIFSLVRNNKATEVFRLLENGADPNTRNEQGNSLLHVAAGPKGGAEITVVLLEAGANPNIQNNKGQLPLHIAAGWCTPQIVEMHILAGADPYVLANDGRSALDFVCSQPADRRQQVVAILREAMSR